MINSIEWADKVKKVEKSIAILWLIGYSLTILFILISINTTYLGGLQNVKI